jgi:hypothetical protein
MANVYDDVTREEALRHRSHCDPRSAEIISSLIGWLDRHQAAEQQRTVSNLELELGAANRELARVRGLLQRLTGIAAKVARRQYLPSLERCKTIRHANHEVNRYDAFHAELAQQLADIALSRTQGAESADIGKLDRVDKKIAHRVVGEILESLLVDGKIDSKIDLEYPQDQADAIADCVEEIMNEHIRLSRGSAETGGEKA